MEPYRIDFTMHRDHEMVLWRDEGIKREDLDEVELQMLQAGAIPRLLPVEWFEMDGVISFHYKLTGKRMLTQRLSHRPFTMNDYYMLVLAVIEGLEDCKHYMLRTGGMLLHENYIFIGEQWDEIALTYVPLRDSSRHGAARENLLSMAVRFTSHIEEVDGAGLQKLFQALNKPSGTFGPVRNLLLALLSEPYELQDGVKRKSVRAEKSGLLEPSAARALSAKLSGTYSSVSSVEIPDQTSPPSDTMPDWLSSPDRDAWEKSVPDTGNDTAEGRRKEDKPSRIVWYACALLAVLIAAVWRFGFFDSPSPASASICAGISFLMIGAGFVWIRKYSGRKRETEVGPVIEGNSGIARTAADYGRQFPEAEPSDKADWNSGARWGAVKQSESDVYGSVINGEHEPGMSDSRLLEENGFPPAGPGTPLQAQSEQDVTVMLGKNKDAAGGAGAGIPYLERTSGNGKAERVWLNKENVVIGRAEESADYADLAEGLSRSHIEIGRYEGTCSARDLGSRNGSMLNGQMMVPYKVYPLNAGDRLQLAGPNGPVYRLCEE